MMADLTSHFRMLGHYNALNALAALAAATEAGVSDEIIRASFAALSGVKRRFSRAGEWQGVAIYDDYAHHPIELRALLDSVKTLGYGRIILAFQPHTYTRTNALFEDFVAVLGRADLLFLAEIYAAREKNTIGISSKDLAERLPGAVYCPSFEDVESRIIAIAGKGDIVLTVGAGDIYKVGEKLSGKNTAAV